jgi:hypothetical protein
LAKEKELFQLFSPNVISSNPSPADRSFTMNHKDCISDSTFHAFAFTIVENMQQICASKRKRNLLKVNLSVLKKSLAWELPWT